jgi:1-acyl-sn-glycerol-3-phosphate acyltransferase
MALIKTAFAFIVVVLSLILLTPLGVLSFIVSLFGTVKTVSFLIYKIAQYWSHLLLKCTGARITVHGRENIPRQGGVCFVSNHGSIVDIILLLALAGRPVGFIAKKELALIPLLNVWILLLGGIFIDRGNIRKAARSIEKGIRRIRAGGGMIIFPEGTRSRGQGLLPFHPGSFKLATRSRAPIVPVAIAGSYEVFERTYRVHAASVSVTFAPPISAECFSETRQALADQVHGVIAGALST